MALFAVVFFTTACAYSNHFIDEEETTDTYFSLTNVNASNYDSWIYINLQTGETETHTDTNPWIYSSDGRITEAKQPQNITIEWHIAIHRYEFKTNNAEVLNTGTKKMDDVNTIPSELIFTPDETIDYETELAKSKKGEAAYLITMDMSEMMDGTIGYALQTNINRVLCNSIIRTATQTMPPTIYSTNGEVMILKWNNDHWAKLQITETYGKGGSLTGASGYISMNYRYYTAK